MDENVIGVECNDELIARFVEFYEQSRMHQELVAFCSKHCEAFSGYDSQDEQDLECMTVFQNYEQLFEKKLAQFFQQQNMEPGEFITHCRRIQTEKPDTFTNFQLVLSAFEYRTFAENMRQLVADGRAAENEADDMGL